MSAPPRRAGRPGRPGGAAARLALAALLCGGACGAPEPPVEVREVATYLLDGERRFETLAASPHGEPSVGELAPLGARDEAYRALLLPPPARVGLDVRAEEDGALLCGFATADLRGTTAEAAGVAELVLELRRGGELLDVVRVDLRPGAAPGWTELGGGAGLRVRAGDALELSTRCLDAAGRPAEPRARVTAAVGRLRLERRARVPRASAAPDRPNLVLVLQDTLRSDRLAVYGGERPTSPRLDALAARGVVFERAYSTAPWTWPATTSLLTGLSPERHGVQDEESCYAAAGLEFLAEALQREGFTTGAFSANGLISAAKNFDQGFETFVGDARGFGESSELVPRALDWLRANADRRFFLYLHLADTHGLSHVLPEERARLAPDVPADFDPADFLRYSALLRRAWTGAEVEEEHLALARSAEVRRAVSDLYDAAVASGDAWLGRVLDELERLRLGDRTVVAFTSDHGEELWDHGLLRHGHSLHGELVRVPLVLAGPGVPRGERRADAVTTADLAPTLARLAGARLRDARGDLLAAGDRGPLFFSTRFGAWHLVPGRTLIRGVLDGDLVLHEHESGAVQLFDLGGDPAELADVADQRPARVAELRELLRERSAAEEALGPGVRGGAGEGELTQELLQGIGYLGD